MRKSDIVAFDVIRHHLGVLDPVDSEDIKLWANESEKNATEFALYGKIILAISSLREWQHFQWKKAWKRISSKL